MSKKNLKKLICRSLDTNVNFEMVAEVFDDCIVEESNDIRWPLLGEEELQTNDPNWVLVARKYVDHDGNEFLVLGEPKLVN